MSGTLFFQLRADEAPLTEEEAEETVRALDEATHDDLDVVYTGPVEPLTEDQLEDYIETLEQLTE